MILLGVPFPPATVESAEFSSLTEMQEFRDNVPSPGSASGFTLPPFPLIKVVSLMPRGAETIDTRYMYVGPMSHGYFDINNDTLDKIRRETAVVTNDKTAIYMVALGVVAACSNSPAIEDATPDDIFEAFGLRMPALSIKNSDTGWDFIAYQRLSDLRVVELGGRLEKDGSISQSSSRISGSTTSRPLSYVL